MFTYKGGHKVGTGTYWDMGTGRRIDVAVEGILPGSDTYVKTPSAVMLLAGPIIGLLYVIVLPFVGIVAAAALGAARIFSGMSSMMGKTIFFGWRPKTAYLAGKKKQEKR